MVELHWEGKYRDGKRVAPVRIALPFQTVETVNESAADRKRTLDLFATGRSTEWRNRLIWGDKKYVLPSLLPDLAGKVNLICIDPPFDTGADFSFTTEVPETDESLEKLPSIIEQKAYRDTWGQGANRVESYVRWFYETIVLLRELLAEEGSIYVHIGPGVAAYVKVVMDEVFGIDNCRGEVVWKRTSSHNDPNKPGNIHDYLFFYSHGDDWVWNAQYQPLDPEYVRKVYVYQDERGRYRLGDLTAAGISRGLTGQEWRGVNPTSFGRHWRRPPDELEVLLKDGRIQLKADGKPSINGWKQYLADSKGMSIQSIWNDIPNVTGISSEKLGYPTQKAALLLERIISASSNPGDLVLDCFVGSGTTAAVAEKLGRRWIACDLGRFAIHTTRKRLLGIPGVKPFVVQNLGKYERQAWMSAEFERPEDRAATEAAYRRFVVDLYHAEPVTGLTWLHGVKTGRMVHVGAVDAPVTLADVKAIAAEVWRAAGRGKDGPAQAAVDVLGWEFAFELNETAKQIAAEARVDVRFRKIPRDVLDKRAVDQGDVQPRDFFELRALSTKLTQKKRRVTLELTDFILPTEDLPEDVAKAVKHWAQWIDYWAVDWNYRDDTFHNEWQSYRTRQDPKLELRTDHDYAEPGAYTIVVKVIDILGNDTTKSVKVRVA